MFWLVVNSLAFVGTPTGLLWGWLVWVKRRHEQAGIRVVMSLIAMLTASLSVLIFFAARFLSASESWTVDRVGLFVAAGSILFSLVGQRRLVVPVWLTSIGAIMLWYGTTLS